MNWFFAEQSVLKLLWYTVSKVKNLVKSDIVKAGVGDGIGIADEIRGLVEIRKKLIEKFENMQSNSQQFLAEYYK